MTVRMLNNGSLADVTIRGAELRHQDDNQVSLYLPGVDNPIVVPKVTDSGDPLDAVAFTDHVPNVAPGELWETLNGGYYRFFVTQNEAGQVLLVLPNHEAWTPAEAVATFGPIQRLSAVAPPAPVEPPDPEAIQLSATDVQIGDQFHMAAGWHTVIGLESPTADDPESVRFYTHLSMRIGVLFNAADDLWVLRSSVPNPVYDQVPPVTIADLEDNYLPTGLSTVPIAPVYQEGQVQ